MDPGRIAVITGGGGGIGLACGSRLGRQRPVLVADVDEGRVERALSELSAQGIEAHGERLDVADPASVGALAERCRSLGGLGALIHTAGLSPSMADGPRILDVNLRGSAHLMAAFGPLCAPGSVAVLIASQSAHLARPNVSPEVQDLLADPSADDLIERIGAIDPVFLDPRIAYGLSKLGVVWMAERESNPWGRAGGRVVSVSPGIIDTEMGRREAEAQPFMAVMVEKTPVGRTGTPDEIASVVEFLCSDAASFVTGCDLLVDGGSTQATLALMAGGSG